MSGLTTIEFRGEYTGEKIPYTVDGQKRELAKVYVQFVVNDLIYKCLAVDLISAVTAASFRARDDYEKAEAEPVPA